MTHQQRFTITMESVDAVGIVFFGTYWEWFEATFEGLIASLSGSSWREVLASGLAMPVVHAEIDYVQPLRLSEQVTVVMRLSKVGTRSVQFSAEYLDEAEVVVARAQTVNVVVGREGLDEIEIPGWLTSSAAPGTADLSR